MDESLDVHRRARVRQRDRAEQVGLGDPPGVALPRVGAVRGEVEDPVRAPVADERRHRRLVTQVERDDLGLFP